MANLSIVLKTTGGAPGMYRLREGWNRITRSYGVHWLRCGPWQILRKSNGVTGQSGGGMHFDQLAIVSDQRFTSLAPRKGEREFHLEDQRGSPRGSERHELEIANGGGHYMLPRAVMTRRLSFDANPTPPPIVSRTLVPTGTVLGRLATIWKGASEQTERRLIADLAAGNVDTSLELMFAATPPWQPLGIHEGYAHGGKDTAPTSGYDCRYALTVLQSDVMRERVNIDLLNADTGEPMPEPGPVDLQQYAYNRGRWGNDWCTPWPEHGFEHYQPKDWNTGTCAYKTSLLAFHIIDGEHLVRSSDDDVAGAALFGDPACFLNARISALRAMAAWPTWRLEGIKTIGVLGRQFGWVAWLVAAVRELATRGGDSWQVPRAELAQYETWLTACAGVFNRTQSPAGTWQVTPYPWPNWSPAPQSASVPTDRGLAQSHEHGILIAGAFAVWRQLPKDRVRTLLGEKIMHAADAWMREGAALPLHWLVGKRGNVYPTQVEETYGTGDSVYMWFAATFASRVAYDQQPSALGRIARRLVGASKPPPDRYLRSMLRKAGNLTPSKFVEVFSRPNQTYTEFNVDAATDMQEAIDRGWRP